MERLYNPDLMSEKEITATFVARQNLIEELLAVIEDQPQGAGLQHVVVIAPRGMGKTTVLLMLRLAIRNSDLSEQWQVVQFPEERYSINDLADFWLEVLDHISVATKDVSLNARVQQLKNRYRRSEDLREAALALIKDWRREHTKRIVVLVDNFDIILEQINDERDNARLRDVLMNDDVIMLVGGATTFFHEARSYDQPLYNFFKIFYLDGLTFDQIEGLLRQRAAFDRQSDFEETLKANTSRLHVLEHFTGGNPRLVLMLYRVITQSDISEVRLGLEKLLDEVTPYYKAKVESLPPQQRKILDYIARRSSETNEGVTPKEIAASTRMSANQASAQIKRLFEQGYVKAANIRGRSSYYSLSERLYSIWHQMRFGSNARHRLQWLVNILKALYDNEEIGRHDKLLQAQFHKHLREGHWNQAHDVLDHRRCLAGASDVSHQDARVFDELIQGYLDLDDVSTVRNEILPNTALESLSEETLNRLSQSGCISEHDRQTALDFPARSVLTDIIAKAQAAFALGFQAQSEKQAVNSREYFTQALRHLDQALQLTPDTWDLWHMKGHALHGLQRYDDALASFQRALEIEPNDVETLNDLGNTLAQLNRLEEAIQKLREALTIDAANARTWYGLAIFFSILGQDEEALKSFDRAIEIKPDMNEAWNGRGNTLKDLGKTEEALTSYEKSLEIDPNQPQVWVNSGTSLINLDRPQDALAKFNRAIELRPNYGLAWADHGIALISLGRYQEALTSLDCAEKLVFKENLSVARGVVLLRLHNYDAALLSFDKALEKDPQSLVIWEFRTECLFENLITFLQQEDRLSARKAWIEALRSRTQLKNWSEIAARILLRVQTADFPFIRELIGESNELKDEFFAISRALDYLITRDETIIERLSPEVRDIVREVVDRFRGNSNTSVIAKTPSTRKRSKVRRVSTRRKLN